MTTNIQTWKNVFNNGKECIAKFELALISITTLLCTFKESLNVLCHLSTHSVQPNTLHHIKSTSDRYPGPQQSCDCQQWIHSTLTPILNPKIWYCCKIWWISTRYSILQTWQVSHQIFCGVCSSPASTHEQNGQQCPIIAYHDTVSNFPLLWTETNYSLILAQVDLHRVSGTTLALYRQKHIYS